MYTIHHHQPHYIDSRHAVTDTSKVSALATAMRNGGWEGRPVIALHDGDDASTVSCLTGTHRIAAAIQAGLDTIPVACISSDDWDAEAQDDWDAYGCDHDQDAIQHWLAEHAARLGLQDVSDWYAAEPGLV